MPKIIVIEPCMSKQVKRWDFFETRCTPETIIVRNVTSKVRRLACTANLAAFVCSHSSRCDKIFKSFFSRESLLPITHPFQVKRCTFSSQQYKWRPYQGTWHCTCTTMHTWLVLCVVEDLFLLCCRSSPGMKSLVGFRWPDRGSREVLPKLKQFC